MAGFLAVVTAVSLATAEWGALTFHTFTFYLLPTRGWEILTGAPAAIYLSRAASAAPSGNKFVSQAGSAVGLVMILYGVWAFNKQTLFPSFYTLAPVLGAALIILFAKEGTFAYQLLSSRAFVGVGLISYSCPRWI